MNMKQKTVDDFMTYATAVIKSRAIPLAEDGLKPVARRILYTMNDMKLKSTAKTVKSANVVGRCMLWHPHGDASIYDALVRMSQSWKMRYPLVYVQGNNGSLNGDPAAAHRYTECRLTAAGDAMLEGLDPDVVKFVPNYDETTTEPTVLSGIFPNLLCNGTEGIAVGVSCSLVPHNLNNVIDVIEAHIKNPALSSKEAASLIVGPDFPLGGEIIDGYKLPEIYKNGFGTITLRAKAIIDSKTNSIMFSEFPYLVDVDRIIEKIQDMVLTDGYSDIIEYENHIGKDSCYIRIICQKRANLNKVLNDLYEQTALQKTVKINNTVIYNGVPMTLSLLGLTNIYINHRHSCIIKAAKKEMAKQQHIQHIQSGLLNATTKIDEVVALIHNSDSKDEARKKLITLLGIDSEQADAILALQLGRLTRLDVNDIRCKIKKAEEETEIQSNIIKNRDERNKIIINDLEKLRKQFGDKRRTSIVMDEPSMESENKTSTAEYVVVDKEGRLYKSSNIEDFKKGYLKADPMKWIYNQGLETFIFNADGSVEQEWSNESRGFYLHNPKAKYIVTITRNGIAKKTPIEEYKKITKLCKVKDGDELNFVFGVNNEDKIIIRREDNKISCLSIDDIKTSGKLTIGIKIANANILNAFVCNDKFYTMNDKGQFKRVEVKDLSKSTVSLNEGCIYIAPCVSNSYYWSRGKFTEFDWDKIAIKSRTSDGAKISASAILVS